MYVLPLLLTTERKGKFWKLIKFKKMKTAHLCSMHHLSLWLLQGDLVIMLLFIYFSPLPRCSSWRKALPRLKAIMMQGWRCSALLTKYSKPPPPPTHPLGQVAGVSAQSFWWGVRMEQNYPSASSPHVSQMAVLSLLLLLLLLLLFFPPYEETVCGLLTLHLYVNGLSPWLC